MKTSSPHLDGVLHVDKIELSSIKIVSACSPSLKFHDTVLRNDMMLAPMEPTLSTGGVRWTLRIGTSDVRPCQVVHERDDVTPSTSVATIKEMIQDRTGQPADSQRML
ncbi:hypothetical protein SPRG_16090 [Saprolegnia parasitica CBS 223.65]|uniref:Ubiquitin-like domain-containing protein n=1 Tax=Saprolegnia parasitica (strain CBS 223.65) TaxID=695850 RepID=A0A067BW71_SAPPC|nr:hypothetical protein SPRG_16090 [Saprolegnia parasitica CBS 223.65]KDO18541.1 hypothetical protein SPRG_16090 [Saprolegnia parasitica CBS 223.65]|eukprot:XP_012210749.1 hypothetical protein SPRG_16090 [Saprolegnia parasitica CBS 223.65]